MLKRILIPLIVLTLLLSGCSSKKASDIQLTNSTLDAYQFRLPEKGEEIAEITTSLGVIKVKFFPELAPKAVENFITHSKNGYYNGLTFHRVIKDFMIQGGDPVGTGSGGESIWGEPFEDEFTPLLHNFRGALSMANLGAENPNTNGSQFFIVQANAVDDELMSIYKNLDIDSNDFIQPTTKEIISKIEAQGKEAFSKEALDTYEKIGGAPWLDYVHTVFGQVFEGMDVVDKIASVKVNNTNQNKPLVDVKIEKIEIVRYE